MIVSHKHRFIFIKTQKTAGTSVEVALSKICGPDDILTPIQTWLEDERTSSAGRGPQNYRLDHPLVPKRAWWKKLAGRPERHYHPSVGYYDHMPAWRVRAYLGEEIWSDYFTFAFERNPWDRQVSWYRYKTKSKAAEEKPSFEAFLADRKRAFVDNYDLYELDGAIGVDYVGQYETLANDFATAVEMAGLSAELRGALELPRVNVSAGPTTDYRSFYTDASANMMADWYAREIRSFGYEF